MINVLIRHKVADFARWKANFDQAIGIRRSAGEKSYRIFCDPEDPRDVTIICEWENLEKAREFTASDTLWKGLHKGGVSTELEMLVLEEVKNLRKTAAD
jgi:hypothetical protein